MPISQILITDTINFGRQVVNEISTKLNQLALTAELTGNLVVNPISRTGVSLNVGAGLILGNGSGIFGLDSNNVSTGVFRNNQLGNSTIRIISSNGVNGIGTVSLGSSILLNVEVVDSITNTRTDLIASANSIGWVQQVISILAANASYPNIGLISVARGGTGVSTISPGQLLIGRTSDGGLVANTIWAGPGIRINAFDGGTTITANVIQGANVNIVETAGAGISISANGPPVGTQSVLGVVRLNDTVTGRTITDAIATANAVNAVHALATQFSVLSQAPGRLIDVAVYKTPGTYVGGWTKKPNTDFVKIVLIGGGGSGASNATATQANSVSQGTYHYFGGYAGALCEAIVFSSNVGDVMDVTVGWGGNSFNIGASTTSVGRNGGNTTFSNTTIIYQANGGPGGVSITTQKNYNTVQFESPSQTSPRAGFGGTLGLTPNTFLEIPGEPPSPIYAIYHSFNGTQANIAGVYLTGANAGNGAVIGSSGGSVPGYSLGGQYIPVLCSGPTRHLGNTIYAGQSVLGPGGVGGRNEDGTYVGSDSSFCAGPTNSNPSRSGSGFGGGGGAGGWHAKFIDIAQGANPSVMTAYARGGASGANGLCIIYSYSVR